MSHPCLHCGTGAEAAGKIGFFCAVFLFGLAMTPVTGFALDQGQAEKIPHVNKGAKENFLQYIYAESNKAFAIAPGGAWAWTALETSETEARRIALERCQSHTQQQCVVYAANDQIVFDKQAWPRLWRLNGKQRLATTPTRLSRGSAFPNLVFKQANGKIRRIRDFKGKVTLVHFWGSWCPPCMREMPGLLRLQKALKKNHGKQVEMVLLQVREPFSKSLSWIKQQQFDGLPVYDSGVKGSDDGTLHIAGGQTVADRQLARAFPSSYVLDQQGRVLFAHTGPIHNWLEYLAFFQDAVTYGKR